MEKKRQFITNVIFYLIIAALVLVAAGLVLLFWKGPRSSCPLRTRILTGIGAMAVSGALMGGGCALAFFTGNLSDQFANLAFAYEDYGFSYCFLQTWLNRGIRRPANYSQKAVADIVRSVEEKTAALSADPQTDVNVIFIQLESYIDPSMIQGLELSEDPVPNWTALKEAYSSGYLTVPVVGAGESMATAAALHEGPVGVIGITPDAPPAFPRILGERLLANLVPDGVRDTRDLNTPAGQHAAVTAARRLREEGAAVIALACTGFSTIGLAPQLERAVGIPVLDPVTCEAQALLALLA